MSDVHGTPVPPWITHQVVVQTQPRRGLGWGRTDRHTIPCSSPGQAQELAAAIHRDPSADPGLAGFLECGGGRLEVTAETHQAHFRVLYERDSKGWLVPLNPPEASVKGAAREEHTVHVQVPGGDATVPGVRGAVPARKFSNYTEALDWVLFRADRGTTDGTTAITSIAVTTRATWRLSGLSRPVGRALASSLVERTATGLG